MSKLALFASALPRAKELETQALGAGLTFKCYGVDVVLAQGENQECFP